MSIKYLLTTFFTTANKLKHRRSRKKTILRGKRAKCIGNGSAVDLFLLTASGI